MNDRELIYNLVTVDIYKTKRALNPSIKKTIDKRILGIKTATEVAELVRKEYPKAYRISIYDGDVNFVGNY